MPFASRVRGIWSSSHRLPYIHFPFLWSQPLNPFPSFRTCIQTGPAPPAPHVWTGNQELHLMGHSSRFRDGHGGDPPQATLTAQRFSIETEEGRGKCLPLVCHIEVRSAWTCQVPAERELWLGCITLDDRPSAFLHPVGTREIVGPHQPTYSHFCIKPFKLDSQYSREES